MNLKKGLIFDDKKANPYNLDFNTWFYVNPGGRMIEIYHYLAPGQIIKIKLPVKALDDTLKTIKN